MQKTPTIKKNRIKTTWYLIDAKNVRLGKLAVKCAEILTGKMKVDNADYLLTGNNIIIINIDKLDITPKKLLKKYYTHSNYPGGIKEQSLGTLLKSKPEYLIRKSVWGMLPKNKRSRHMLTNLHIVTGEEHKYSAQNPIIIQI